MDNLNSLNTSSGCAHKLPCGICEKLKERCPVSDVAINYCCGANGNNSTSANPSTSANLHISASVQKEDG